MSHQVPEKGSAVFPPVPDDKRGGIEFRVSGRIVYGRLPGPSGKGTWKEPVREIIRMEDKPFSRREYPDPYRLDGV